ncbi:MAG TPA: single-stranded-DNA-specific exonuclease RecJ [Candidatus Binatus sp.]|nr:single-stranded-DNA-specific exonuclease RecJ [Candidatus Binatus sp.]
MLGRWVWRGREGALPRPLCDAVGDLQVAHAPLIAHLLWNRGIRDPEAAAAFLRPTLAHGLRSPSLLKDMDRACTRLVDALGAGEPIGVYGDYDVDGMTGAAQLVVFLRELGAEPILHVSHRGREGYGLNAGALRGLREAGARVVVTADCGTADVDKLIVAAELGLDVIVCDHHHTPIARPPAMALLNPLQPDCAFPFKGLSGAGVVFYLLMGVRAELRARGHRALPDLRRYLDLVALGTVADVVPLREENRVLVTHGLRVLDRPARPGLIALREAALVETASVRSIGFRLAPRLNAGGRLADARLAVELLTTDNVERARAAAAELEMHNAERRAIEDAMVAEAIRAIETSDRKVGARTIVVARDGWHPGVVGIVAARLAERFHRPALVVALDGELGRGSGRSVRGVDLHGAVAECGELLPSFGGHRQAVGFTVPRERVAELAARFEDAVARATTPADLEPLLEIDAEVPLAVVTSALAEALAVLEPHGAGNPEPTLLARAIEVDGVRLVGDPGRPHLKLRLRQDVRTLSAIGFGLGHLPVRAGDRVDVVFTPRLTRWQGTTRLELEVLDLRGASARQPRQAAENAGEFRVP